MSRLRAARPPAAASAVAAVATLLVAAPGAGAAARRPAARIVGGITAVRLAPDVRRGLAGSGVTIAVLPPATANAWQGTRFGIVAGRWDRDGRVGWWTTRGTWEIGVRGRRVRVTGFDVVVAGPRGTIRARIGASRVPFATLSGGREVRGAGRGRVGLAGYTAVLAPDAARVLGASFGAALVPAGLRLGRVTVTLRLGRPVG